MRAGLRLALLCLLMTSKLVWTSASSGAGPFFDDFDGDTLDASQWLVAHRNWGGKNAAGEDYNGGVIPQNVSVGAGLLRLRVLGNHYAGHLRGIAKDGNARSTGQRVGAAVATRAYFGSGRFEVRMKVVPRLGAASAMWTFHYQERRDGTIANHEVDIEVPGRPGAVPMNASFDHALLSTYTGESEAESTTVYRKLDRSIADGEFHTFRFDWYAGATGELPRVEFWIDGKLQATLRRTVPFIRGRLWIGAWFPRRWAGEPDFEQDELLVDWVRITPFAGHNDMSAPETYPDHGWAR
jgi:hypothetical protein